ncbi:hypothetical protein [Rhizobium leguminosarum]|uniref:hypothetical protein n=1 Tax=Rhizobium leguminosarum TaxID=384 RepID=UPI0013DD221A|nr:hypothetical protein [Rhizobium leguminosarum]NEJ82162.1 hypothetical protein [Rhizobium leguminosarum]
MAPLDLAADTTKIDDAAARERDEVSGATGGFRLLGESDIAVVSLAVVAIVDRVALKTGSDQLADNFRKLRLLS